jgi:hypothetical protein
VEKQDVAFSKFIEEIRQKAKASFDVCQARCGENKLDILPRDFERAKTKF